MSDVSVPLSALHYLTLDSPSRPRSRGSAALSSVMPQAARVLSSPALAGGGQAFSDFPDFSKMNTKRHNSVRTDTFKTASGLQRRCVTPGASAEEHKCLNDTHVVAGLRHDLREIGHELLTGVEDETQTMMAAVQKYVQESLAVLTDTRETTLGALQAQISDHVTGTLEAAGWPLKVDFEPLREEIRSGEEARAEAHRASMRLLEDRIASDMGTPLAELAERLRAEQRQMRDEARESEERVRNDLKLGQEALASDLAALAESLRTLQADRQSRRNSLQRKVSNIPHLLGCQDLSLGDTVVQVLEDINMARQEAKGEAERIREEVGSSHASLSYEIAGVRATIGEALLDGSTKQASLSPCVEMWVQTERVEVASKDVQTEENGFKNREEALKGVMQSASGVPTRTRSKSNMKRPSERKALNNAGRTQGKGPQAIFQDSEAMKMKARKVMIKPQYTTHDYYHETGFAQMVAKKPWFENLTFSVVLLNSIWIAVDTDMNDDAVLVDAHPVFQVAENLFCSYFFVEIIVRFFAFRRSKYVIRDAWFMFDFTLLLLMVVETWVLSFVFLVLGNTNGADVLDASFLRMARMLKLLRLSRMARLVRAVPELLVLLKGLAAACRSVSVFFLMWAIIIYVFAVVFVQLAEGDMKDEFMNVPTAMQTLLLDGILPNNAYVVRVVAESNPWFWPIIMAFVLLASLTLSYMLIGVLVETVHTIASTEKEVMLTGFVASHLRKEWVSTLRKDMEDKLSKQDFQDILLVPSIARFLHDTGVDMVVLVDMSDMIYDDIVAHNQAMGFEHFVDAVLSMRGTNTATVKDIKSQLRIMKAMLKESIQSIEVKMESGFVRTRNEVRKQTRSLRDDDDEESGSEESVSSSQSPTLGESWQRQNQRGSKRMSRGPVWGSVGPSSPGMTESSHTQQEGSNMRSSKNSMNSLVVDSRTAR